MSPHTPSLDSSARAGLMLAAVSVGLSYQPNLLTRRSLDQGIITGVSALAAYSWGVSVHSALDRMGERIGGSRGRGFGDAAVVIGSLAVAATVPWREHERRARAATRLGAFARAAAGAAGVAGRALQGVPGNAARSGVTAAAVLGVGGLTYAATRMLGQQVGALGLEHVDDHGNELAEDLNRSVNPVTAAGIGVAVSGVLLGLASVESRLNRIGGRLATGLLGGSPDDHASAARLFAAAVTAAAGYGALRLADSRLGSAGEGIEPAHAQPPDIPEITGSPASGRPWSEQSREGRRWLSMVLRPEGIAGVMGEPAKAQPIRIYASLLSADTEEGRAQVLLDEIDRTRALERPYVALWSPTGSGYVNYVACETFEYLTRGDCASMAVEYSVLPSSLSLADVERGTRQTRMVFDGIVARLAAMDAASRPKIFLFGESLGSQVSEEMFTGQGAHGPEGLLLDAALWIGTPSATRWRKELWGERTVAQPPPVGPGPIFVTRWIGDWQDLHPGERERVRFLLLQNGDDPIPKFGSQLMWRRPDWLGPRGTRPPGAPSHTIWWPITTFTATFIDMLNALTPTPGLFAEGGHDYRLVLPETIRQVWRIDASDVQMASMQVALRRRELGWETKRRWMEAQAQTDPAKRQEEVDKVLVDVAKWTEQPSVTPEDVERIIAEDCQPT